MSIAPLANRLKPGSCREDAVARGIGVMLAMIAALLLIPSSAAADSAKTGQESPLTVPLKVVGGSGVQGVATFAHTAGFTVVDVALTGIAGESYLPDIRAGTCVHAAGLPDVPLSIVASGSASSTTIDLSMTDLLAGKYVVMIHSATPTVTSLDPDSAVACGRILRNRKTERGASTPTPAPVATSTPLPMVATTPITGAGPAAGAAGHRLTLPLAIAGALAGLAGMLFAGARLSQLALLAKSARTSPPIAFRQGRGGGTK